MDDTLRLWDSLFAADARDPNESSDIEESSRFQYIDFVSVAIVLNLDSKLRDESDFAEIMEML